MDDDWDSDRENLLREGDGPGDYEVGRSKPPVHSRFKKGNPGGPGRPKGSGGRRSDLLSELEDALDTKVSYTENGRTKRKSFREIGHQNLAKRYAKGDLAAIKLVHAIREAKGGAKGPFEDIEDDLVITLDLGDPEMQERVRQRSIQREVERQLAEILAADGMRKTDTSRG